MQLQYLSTSTVELLISHIITIIMLIFIFSTRFFIQSWTYMLLQKTKEIYNLWSFLLGVMGWWWCVRLFDARSEIGIKQEYAYTYTSKQSLDCCILEEKRHVVYTILSYLLVEKLLHTHAFAYKASQLYKKKCILVHNIICWHSVLFIDIS